MDLSFALQHDHHRPIRALPTALAVLLVEIAARQAASPTARLQMMLDGAQGRVPDCIGSAQTTFNRATAAVLSRHRLVMNAVFT